MGRSSKQRDNDTRTRTFGKCTCTSLFKDRARTKVLDQVVKNLPLSKQNWTVPNLENQIFPKQYCSQERNDVVVFTSFDQGAIRLRLQSVDFRKSQWRKRAYEILAPTLFFHYFLLYFVSQPSRSAIGPTMHVETSLEHIFGRHFFES